MALLAIVMCCLSVTAQTITPCKGVAPDGYNFWLSTPSTGDTNTPKPLVVFLHGSSLCGNDLNRVMRYGSMAAVKKGLNIDAYVIAPQNPGGSWKPAKVMADIEWVEKNYKVDKNRIYVLGMSLGGYGTIDMAAAYPHHIAAAMALCGGGTSKTLENLNEVPLWIVHGLADNRVSIAKSDKVVDRMKAADPETPRLQYDRVPGMNHGTPARFFYMPDTYRWLMAHSLTDEDRPICATFPITKELLRTAYQSLRDDRSLITPHPTIDAVGDLLHAPGTRTPISVTL